MSNFKIIGNSDNLKEALNIAGRIAKTDAAVLLYGESGVGKELFARYIYEKSKRSNTKFVAINCAAIPDELLENELFGHKKGAYTDASEDQIGKFGYANNGVIFLDEIGELDIQLQSKLLRVLQFKEYEPIGSTVTIKSDVRIIAASNKNLKDLVLNKTFREDLYYRLNVVPITIPPLRDRKGDVEILTDYFFNIYNTRNNKKIKNISSSAIELLKNYNWPGNVRELQNVIERAVVLCTNEIINVENIILDNKINKENNINKSLKDAVNDFKKDFIIKSLEKNNWNQTKTALSLKIQRTYLSRLIKELEIDKI